MHSINALAVRSTSFLAQHSIARCQVWHCEERKRHLRKLKLRSSNFVAKCECFVLARKAAAHEAIKFAIHIALLWPNRPTTDIDSDIRSIQIFMRGDSLRSARENTCWFSRMIARPKMTLSCPGGTCTTADALSIMRQILSARDHFSVVVVARYL